ncbi:MAG: DUF3422 family protein [Betaproteobacteria bacterium]
MAPRLPADHPQRLQLAAEVHARPPARVQSPAVITVLALTDAPASESLAAVRTLAAAHGATPVVSSDAAHLQVELAGARIKWERHGEFVTLTVVQAVAPLTLVDLSAQPRFPTALDALPADWLAALPGRTMACSDVLLLPFAETREPELRLMARWFDAEAMAGSQVLDEAAWVFTDFAVKHEGRSRWLALDAGMGGAQTARVVQRIAEIEIYRMMALLGFPLARAVFPELNRIEQELERITAATAALHAETNTPAVQTEEQRLLDELSRLASEVERSVATSAFRFSAAQAYWAIERARLAEFREHRLGELRTLSGFLSRRMSPAMDSCAAATRRQDEISARIERASSLLRTRVDIAREEQNQRLLAAMERRGTQQLRLQQTVEGLSIAAVTYYGVGLVTYLARPLSDWWPVLQPEAVTALAIPLVALAVWTVLRRMRARLALDEEGGKR